MIIIIIIIIFMDQVSEATTWEFVEKQDRPSLLYSLFIMYFFILDRAFYYGELKNQQIH
jgi:hypothetical protein